MKTKELMKMISGLIFVFVLSSFVAAQETVRKTTTTETTKTAVVQNDDGTYTVIEYPVDKEVTVELSPVSIKGATGSARVMRTSDGTRIFMNLADVSGDITSYHVYAVDSSGMPTYLGPVSVKEGIAEAEFSTPLSQFMLMVSPTEGLQAIDKTTSIVFRSAVPTGYAVVPVGDRFKGGDGNMSVEAKENQRAVTNEVSTTYNVPLLNVPTFDNDTTEIDISFSGELQGLKGKAYIDPRKDGATQIKMRFDDMKMAPKDKRFVLWASSPDGEYTKLGQVINTGKRQESEIRSETALKDFGLFVTMEEKDVASPTSKTYSVIKRKP
jgi:hypothetical protein